MLDLLRQRRSVRFYKPTPVAPEQLELLLEAVLRAPSSRGFQPWEFIVVRDPPLIEKLSIAKGQGSAFLARAPLAIVVVADPGKSDVWIEDCSIAAIILQLAAEALGLGSCWAQIRNRAHNASLTADEYLKGLLGLPEHFAVECIVGIGQPAEHKKPHPVESLRRSQVHFEKYCPVEG
jgi:nitroreductase